MIEVAGGILLALLILGVGLAVLAFLGPILRGAAAVIGVVLLVAGAVALLAG